LRFPNHFLAALPHHSKTFADAVHFYSGYGLLEFAGVFLKCSQLLRNDKPPAGIF
jgi:hypothetical protein